MLAEALAARDANPGAVAGLLAEAAVEHDRDLADRAPLADALADAMSGPFLAADAWAEAEAQAREAQAAGLALPPLPRALQDANLTDANALGRWLGKSRRFENVGTDGGRVVWCVISRDTPKAVPLVG